MGSPIKVNVKEDNSVEKLLDKTAEKLQNKYEKQRKINMAFLKKPALWQSIALVVLQVLCIIIVLFSTLSCIANLNSKLKSVPVNIRGYSLIYLNSGTKDSMAESGFKSSDMVIVHSVNPHTLKGKTDDYMGDMIAYYVTGDSIHKSVEGMDKVTDYSDQVAYTSEWKNLFGYQSDTLTEAGKIGASVFFHHIKEIYQDADGVWWFVTYGSSNVQDGNIVDDKADYVVREDLIIGSYDNSYLAKFNTLGIRAMQNFWGVVLVLFPIIVIIVVVILECMRDIQISKLQKDVVEEKRKITDPICVENEVGFAMDESTKRKVLAQAPEKERLAYIALLWRDGTVPAGIKKYLLRRKQMLGPTEKLLEVNRKCQQMFKDGVDPKEIAQYYQEEKSRIEQEETAIRRKMRELHKRYDDAEYTKRQAEIDRIEQEVTEEMVSLQLQSKKEEERISDQEVRPKTKKSSQPTKKQPAKKPVAKKVTTKTNKKENANKSVKKVASDKTNSKKATKTSTKKVAPSNVKPSKKLVEKKASVASSKSSKTNLSKEKKADKKLTAKPTSNKTNKTSSVATTTAIKKNASSTKQPKIVAKKEKKVPQKKLSQKTLKSLSQRRL